MSASYSRTRRRLLFLGMLAMAIGCRDTVVAPRDLKVPDPTKLIMDGAHNGGNSDVFWLVPMALPPVNAPGFGDPFDANEPVEFWICSFATMQDQSATCDPNNLIKRFSPSDVQVSTQLQDYHAFWNTRVPELNTNLFYRIEARIGSQRLALADVKLITNLKQVINLITNQIIPLPDDWTLPLRIRIEKGWNCKDRVNRNCTSQVVGNTPIGQPTIVIAPNNTAAGSFEGNWIPFCATGQTTNCVPQGTQVVVTIEDQTNFLNQAPAGGGPAPTCALINNGTPKTHMLSGSECVKFTTDPVFKFASPVKVAVCVDADDQTQQLVKYDVNETPRFLRNVPFLVNGVPFTVLCEQGAGHIGSRSSNRIMNLAMSVGRALRDLVTPKSAFALHNGVGGLIEAGDGFSYVAPGRPLTLSKNSGDLQTGTVGVALSSPIKVQISTVHLPFDFESGFPDPLNTLPVLCSIDQGSGTFPAIGGPPSSQVTVFTDANGIATCPPWILGSVGANTMHVSTANIDNGIIAVEDVQGDAGLVPQPITLSNTATFTATGTAAGQFIDFESGLDCGTDCSLSDQFQGVLFQYSYFNGEGTSTTSPRVVLVGNNHQATAPIVAAGAGPTPGTFLMQFSPGRTDVSFDVIGTPSQGTPTVRVSVPGFDDSNAPPPTVTDDATGVRTWHYHIAITAGVTGISIDMTQNIFSVDNIALVPGPFSP